MQTALIIIAALVLLPAVVVVNIWFGRRRMARLEREFDESAKDDARLAAALDRAQRYLAGEDVYDVDDEEAVRRIVRDALRGERGEKEKALAEEYLREKGLARVSDDGVPRINTSQFNDLCTPTAPFADVEIACLEVQYAFPEKDNR
jgi:hypothetical protein